MLEFYSSEFRKAAKQHTCHICGISIQPGEKYCRESGKYDGDFFDRCTCRVCNNVRDNFFRTSVEAEYDLWEISDCAVSEVCISCPHYQFDCGLSKSPLRCSQVRKHYE